MNCRTLVVLVTFLAMVILTFSVLCNPHENGQRIIEVGLIADIHMRNTSRAIDIPNASQCYAMLAEFVVDMKSFNPAFVVQLGDMADGNNAAGGHVPIADIVCALRQVGTYLTDNLPIPLYHVIGNHEYHGAELLSMKGIYRAYLYGQHPMKTGHVNLNQENDMWDMTKIYQSITDEWNDVSDTWYHFDSHGYRFIVLNSAYSDTAYCNSSGHTDHYMPEAELTWLSHLLNKSDMPVVAFMHIPVTKGAGIGYDSFAGEKKVATLFAGYDKFICGIFGHVHHTYDHFFSQTDCFGNIYYHISAPYHWNGDTNQSVWGKLRINPDNQTVRLWSGSGVDTACVTGGTTSFVQSVSFLRPMFEGLNAASVLDAWLSFMGLIVLYLPLEYLFIKR